LGFKIWEAADHWREPANIKKAQEAIDLLLKELARRDFEWVDLEHWRAERRQYLDDQRELIREVKAFDEATKWLAAVKPKGHA
jgi:hypothetical protein